MVVTLKIDSDLIVGELNKWAIRGVYTLRGDKLIPRCPSITVNNTMKQADNELAFLYRKTIEGKTNV